METEQETEIKEEMETEKEIEIQREIEIGDEPKTVRRPRSRPTSDGSRSNVVPGAAGSIAEHHRPGE